jgi:hypothetical protein
MWRWDVCYVFNIKPIMIFRSIQIARIKGLVYSLRTWMHS